jgi:hypothetical protein
MGNLQKPVGQGGFPVVDMGNNAEIPDIFLFSHLFFVSKVSICNKL